MVFDPDTIIDTATYIGGLSYSEGIQHVLVSGTLVVGDGKLIEGSFPGKLVVGPVVGSHNSEITHALEKGELRAFYSHSPNPRGHESRIQAFPVNSARMDIAAFRWALVTLGRIDIDDRLDGRAAKNSTRRDVHQDDLE